MGSNNEKMQYYFCGMINGGECVKCYKPSVAKLVMERHGFRYMHMIPTIKPEKKKKRKSFNRDERRRRRIVSDKPYYQPYGMSMEGLL